MDPFLLFDFWRKHKSANHRDPLSELGSRSYASIWRSWIHWLSEETDPCSTYVDARYLIAKPEQISRFLSNGPSPRSSRRSKSSPLSDITRRRYWRVLDSIYEHACFLGLLEANPASSLGHEKPPSEKSVGQIFHPPHLLALEAGLPHGLSVWSKRDLAILLLMLDSALTVSEVCQLELSDVYPSTIYNDRLDLKIDGKRQAQCRELTLNQRTSTALKNWISVRTGIATKSRVKSDPVFLTERCYELSPRVIFHLVATTVEEAFHRAQLELPMHMGPQVLRNTCIVRWLNSGVQPAEVVRRSGFKDSKSFRGLRAYIN